MNKKKTSLFLDRDGVINLNRGYVHKISDFEFIPGIYDICKFAIQSDMLIFVITNQSGIGRGYFSENDYVTLTNWMLNEFRKQGITITRVFHAPENPDIPDIDSISKRKPSPTMILEAAEMFNVDLANSVFIGDSESDMVAAKHAGVKNRILISKDLTITVANHVAGNHLECLEILKKTLSFRGGCE